MKTENTDFFERLSEHQKPNYLWIGCSDSRVPANQICGLDPGEIFVHRNVANLVAHTDFNCLSVLQYAVEVLKVKHIIICGHYGCGGVNAALSDESFGLIDNWLRNIKDVYYANKEALKNITNLKDKQNRLAELNVAAQVANLCYTTIIQNAWRRSQNIFIHGWIYGLKDGLLKDLDLCVNSHEQLPDVYKVK